MTKPYIMTAQYSIMSKRNSGSIKEESLQKQYGMMIASTDLMFQKIGDSLAASGMR